ncbi:hypothetical protein [Corynebacterium marquesiae]|uniref:Uncharacterized protein n=1 Tax=Corynebacterium marquesiae TaxID=2913503 RepID=A0ABU8P4A0_9CORY|nr:hypothetical protein [Corynebacterium marquesiae]MDK8496503.1 hypothetical protein [Corynebacterium marquesiae]
MSLRGGTLPEGTANSTSSPSLEITHIPPQPRGRFADEDGAVSAPPGSDYFGELLFMAHPLPPGGRGNGDPGRYLGELPALEG